MKRAIVSRILAPLCSTEKSVEGGTSILAMMTRLMSSDDKGKRMNTPAYVSIRQHMSAYVSIRQHMNTLCQHTSDDGPEDENSAYVSICQHTGV